MKKYNLESSQFVSAKDLRKAMQQCDHCESHPGRCDHEMGSIKKGWKLCNGRSNKKYKVTGSLGDVYYLHYCKKHDIKEKRFSCRYEKVTL